MNSCDVSTPLQFTVWDLDAAFESLNKKAAAGLGGISAPILQLSFPVVRSVLLHIFNCCLRIFHFPPNWKVVKVSIIGKPNKPHYDSINSFRPISLGSNISKLFEKMLLGRLELLSVDNGWISNNQHRFHQGRSTESAAHSLVTRVEAGFSKRMCTVAAFFRHIKCLSNCPTYLIKVIKVSCQAALRLHLFFCIELPWAVHKMEFCLLS